MPKRYYDYDTLRGAMHDVILGNGAKHRCIDAGMILDLPQADVVEINCAYNEKEDTPSLFRCSNCNWYCNDTTPGDKTDGDDPYSYNYCPNCGRRIRRKKDAKTN